MQYNGEGAFMEKELVFTFNRWAIRAFNRDDGNVISAMVIKVLNTEYLSKGITSPIERLNAETRMHARFESVDSIDNGNKAYNLTQFEINDKVWLSLTDDLDQKEILLVLQVTEATKETITMAFVSISMNNH